MQTEIVLQLKIRHSEKHDAKIYCQTKSQLVTLVMLSTITDINGYQNDKYLTCTEIMSKLKALTVDYLNINYFNS